jgi:hypothetical protein
MAKKIVISIISIAVILLIRLFCGVYIHDEFGEKHFFLKHRPVWKWEFYSPIGMTDLKMEQLSKEKQIEQNYFSEFVSERGLSL